MKKKRSVMYSKPKLKNVHPNLEEYDNGAAFFIKPLGFCCEDPWDYITNNGEYPEYWKYHSSDYDAIEHFLEDRGFKSILNQIENLQAQLKEAEEIIKLISPRALSDVYQSLKIEQRARQYFEDKNANN